MSRLWVYVPRLESARFSTGRARRDALNRPGSRRHFLKDTDFTREEVSQIFGVAARLKRERGKHDKPLAG